MNQHSSAELDPVPSPAADVPLSDRPLLAEDQKTVVSSAASDSESVVDLIPIPDLTAQEIRDQLFPATGTKKRDGSKGLYLGHFRVEEQVGAGGMGAVFRAVDLELSRDVALKVLNPVTAADPGLVARFRNEARACAQLNHDNIARVHFTGQQEGVHFIAYEFAPGKTIRELITQFRQLPSADVVNYSIQLTLALSHMNFAGVVHRDIKPSNIILSDTGRIKVVDLGLARRESTDSVGDLTVAGTTLGTFDYIAPEQARDPRLADIRSDIYSLGCTMYHMLTGQPPYPEGTALQKLLDHQGKSPPDPRAVAASVPTELAAITQKMMNTDPDRRYQDPGQLLVDLTSLANHLGLRTVPAEGVVWRRVPIKRVREMSGAIFLTGAVMAICAAALTMHFFPNDGRSLAEAELILQRVGRTSPANNVAQTEAQIPQQADLVTPPSPGEPDDGLPIANVAPASETEAIEQPVPEPPLLAAAPKIRIQSADGTSTPQGSLAKAWSEAKSGDEIVLDFDGPLGEPIPCMNRIKDTDAPVITIRAADERKPILQFQGDVSSNSNGSTTPGRLFDLSNGLKLKIVGVRLEVTVRSDVESDHWVLFELNGPNRVEMEDCHIQFSNPMQSKRASVVRVLEPTVVPDSNDTSIRLRNVVVLGGCDVVSIEALASGEIEFNQCAFGINGSVVRNLGSADPFSVPGRINVSLNQVTCVSSRPAFQLQDSESLNPDSEPDSTLAILDVRSDSSVYASTTDSGTLVECIGNIYVAELEEWFVWNGSHNIYYNMEQLWLVQSGLELNAPVTYDFTQWVDLWIGTNGADEMAAVQAGDDLWPNAEILRPNSLDEFSNWSKDYFQISRSVFFTDDSGTPYKTNDAGEVPGVDVESLPSLRGN